MSGQKKELADLRIRSTILQFNSSSLCKLFLFFFFFSFFRGLAGRNEYTGLTRGSRVNSFLPVFRRPAKKEKKHFLHLKLELNIPKSRAGNFQNFILR